jgi:uroporphyrinogen decarboxylase
MSDSLFLQACGGAVPSTTPVWLMRQAGRILQPYRELKEKTGSILGLFKNPTLAAEVTLMPVAQLGVDAAILFADILTPIEPMGCEIDFKPGPVFADPVRTREAVDALDLIDSRVQLAYVMETIQRVRDGLPADIPLIGFGGGPITLATYMVEGGSAKSFSQFRRFLHADPEAATRLLDKLTDVVIDYLTTQVEAGVQAIQLFDTWVGTLSRESFRIHALPSLQRIFAALEGLGVPRIYFPLDAAHLLPLLPETGADIFSIDWRIDMADAFDTLPNRPLQGNLDPVVLFASPEVIRRETRQIMQRCQGRPHIFNLGHGVLPDTPVENVRVLVEAVHEFGDGQ